MVLNEHDKRRAASIRRMIRASPLVPDSVLGGSGFCLKSFARGRKRNLVSHNPANAVEVPAPVERAPAIFTPDQVRTILEFARGFSNPAKAGCAKAP
jgi:hypothetical protein